MPTVEDLGRSLKAKYPGKYDDLSDADLGSRVRAKYPAYNDYTDAPAQSAPAGLSRRDVMNAIPTMLPGVSAGQLAGIAPQALGFTGGVVGGPGGAAIGGTLGETARQALLEEQIDPGRIAGEGAFQGGLGLVGSGLGSLARMASRTRGLAPWVEPTALVTAKRPPAPPSKMASMAGNALRMGLPIGGYASGGIPGALVGAALPQAGRVALRAVTHPRTAALLASPAFQQIAKQSPRAAGELVKEALASDEAGFAPGP